MEIFKLFGTILIKDEEALQRLNHVDKVAQNTSSKFSNMISNIGKIGLAFYFLISEFIFYLHK